MDMNAHHSMPDSEEVHLQDYLHVLLRRKKSFIIAFSAIFFSVAIYSYLATPIYEASGTLYVKDEKAKQGVLGELALLTSANPIDAELEILKSRTNMEEVVRRLNLNRVVLREKGKPSLAVVEFSCPEIPGKPSKYFLRFTGNDSFTVLGPQKEVLGEGRTGAYFQKDGVRLLVSGSQAAPGEMSSLTLVPFQDTVDGVRRGVKAAEVGKKTNVIRVSYQSANPEKARNIVNTLVNVYLERAVAVKAEEASKTVNFIDNQLNSLKDDLELSATALQAYKASSGIIKLDTEAQELVRKLADAEKERAAVSLQKKQAEFALSSMKDAAKRGVVHTPADPVGGPLAAKLIELEAQKKALLADNTESHPAVRAVQSQIDEVQRKLQSTYENFIRNSASQEAALGQRLGQFEGKLKNLPAEERDLARLERVAKVNADIYTMLLGKREEARVAKAATISNIKIVDPAITPSTPVKPQKRKNVMLGFLLGCMAGVGLAFFRDYMNDTIKDPEQAKRVLGLPLLAVIPFLPKSEDGVDVASILQPKSIGAEAFRSIRTALHFSSVGRESKVLLLTSTFQGEGKSTVSSNLGFLLAQTNPNVVLIDCDLRRPSIHVKFDTPKTPGLTEIISGDASFEECLHRTDVGGLQFITGGTIPPNPAELLASDAMRKLIEDLRGKYDKIILDAPPVLAVTDTPVLSAYADDIVVVMETERVPAKGAVRMREVLHATGTHVAGLVFNDKTNRGEAYGYYGYYGYGYYAEESINSGWRKWLPLIGLGKKRKVKRES